MTKHFFFLIILSTVIVCAKPLKALPCSAKNPQIIDHLYNRSYGKCQSPALIFLHGGPGFYSYNFEFSTAEKLAQLGYHVIVYDRRGTGYSPHAKSSSINFNSAIKDLKLILEAYHLKKVTLLGHSFGGTLALKFIDRHPDLVKQIILMASPLSYPSTLSSLINESLRRYPQAINVAAGKVSPPVLNTYKQSFGYLNNLKGLMFPSSGKLNPSYFNDFNVNFIFTTAMNLGLYSPSHPSLEAQKIYRESFVGKPQPPQTKEEFVGFMTNENYALMDLQPLTKKHRKKLCGIYAAEDFIVGKKDLATLKKFLPSKRYKLLKGASHNLFIDQQSRFLEETISCLKRI